LAVPRKSCKGRVTKAFADCNALAENAERCVVITLPESLNPVRKKNPSLLNAVAPGLFD
jgi:hypothetical protein